MAGTLGRVEEFDGDRDYWPQYVERLEHFFVANGIEGAEKKRAVLLSVIGATMYKTLWNLVSPTKPSEKTYDQLVEALTKHYKPVPSEIVERFKFHSRSRKPGESVATFIAELRSLAEFCNFGDTLEAMLRDRIVGGINDDAIQKRLLSESALDYTKAVEMAMNMETAVQSVRELKSQPDASTRVSNSSVQVKVYKTIVNPTSQQDVAAKTVPTCYRCGLRGHTLTSCHVDKNVVCHHCHKKGHMQRAFKSKQRATRSGKRKSQTICRVEEESKPTLTIKVRLLRCYCL